MRMFVIGASLVLAVSVIAQDPVDNAASPKSAMAEFLRASAGQWVTQWHPATGTPNAIYGTGLPLADWRENSLAEARRHALQLLTTQKELLGLGASDFRESIGARMGRSWSFTFDQIFHGVPAIGGRADVRVNMRGVIAMFGSQAWPIPTTFDTKPAIAEEVAVAIAWDTLGVSPTGVRQPATPGKPRLVIWGDIDAAALAPFFLAWEIPVSNVDQNGNGPIGRYYIDAKTGAVLHFQNDKHECGIPGCTLARHRLPAVTVTASTSAPPVLTTVTVMGWTRTGQDATSALVNTPLRGIVLNVPGIGNMTTDVNGQFTVDIAAAVNIAVGALDGTHHAPIIDSTASGPTGSFTVNPGVNSTIQLLTAAATTNQAAHTSLTYWVDQVNEFSRSILGNSSQLATASTITPTVNQTGTCNAYYTGNTIHFYPTGGGCNNTAFSTVVAHEWAHGLDDRYGGISNAANDGLSEGWGDIFGEYLVDSNLLGLGFQTAGVALRNGLNTKLYGTQTEVHNSGEIWMGFAWRYRDNLRTAFGTPMAIAISNDTVIGSIVANATNQANAVIQVFIADDDDGNLLNGVPHYAQLSAAAIAKGMPYPQVVVANISHTALTTTTQRLTPRIVDATVTPLSGTITLVRLHFNAGAGNIVRNMKPNGAVNGYHAMLPGRTSGPVTYHIEAVHSGGTTVRLPVSGEFSYEVDAGFSGFFLANFDSGSAGWTSAQVLTQNDWQVGDPAGKSGAGWADPQTAASGLNCYANDLGNTIGATVWNGAYAANVENYLRSPLIDCTGRTGVQLRFKRWLTVEDATFDQATVYVNGVQVWRNAIGANHVDTAWQTVTYSIPIADNNPAVQIEWHLKSDAGLQLGGWNIDDIELGVANVVVVDADLTLLPEQAVQASTLTLTVTTPSNSRPFLIGVADGPGPTLIPGIPTLWISGTIDVVAGTTDALGNASFVFPAPNVPSATGQFFYSQVLTVDAAFTQFVTSNPFINLITQTL